MYGLRSKAVSSSLLKAFVIYVFIIPSRSSHELNIDSSFLLFDTVLLLFNVIKKTLKM